MKYVVEINGERRTVALGPEGVRYEGDEPVSAELSDMDASPVTIMRIGAEVHRVVVIEAMKMENELRSPIAGRIAELRAVEGTLVDPNAVLVVIEPFD